MLPLRRLSTYFCSSEMVGGVGAHGSPPAWCQVVYRPALLEDKSCEKAVGPRYAFRRSRVLPATFTSALRRVSRGSEAEISFKPFTRLITGICGGPQTVHGDCECDGMPLVHSIIASTSLREFMAHRPGSKNKAQATCSKRAQLPLFRAPHAMLRTFSLNLICQIQLRCKT